MKRMSLMALAAVLLTAGPGAAQSLQNCAKRELVLSRLTEGYGESRQAIGLGANNTMVETFASDETGSWTIIVTTASGVSCIVASGQAYEQLTEQVASAKDSDA